MKSILTMVFVLGFFSLSHATEFKFANIKTGQEILTAEDNYFNRMSPAEIAIRTLSQTADKTVRDLKAQYRANVLEWTDQEKDQITQLVADNRERLDRINHLLPAEIIFIKVTELVEGGMPHTRANAIILPLSDKPLSETLFFHELFHVLTRKQKTRHNSLYGLIGFLPCDFTGNEVIRAMTLTNPDVPAGGYYLPVKIAGRPSAIMTFLHAAKPAFDPGIEGGFGGHFGFGLLKVTVEGGKCRVDTDTNGKIQILAPASVPDFFAAIGQNTSYIIHAEEVLAENFVFAITGKEDLPNPEIPARLNAWLDVK
ncbi:MAG: hypothetical protein COB49_04920 [Alphaproteobacteria bacterium]|nr:MAG: hypothetical protein COB49_04920 [Alphaproteobacteria bacterium]